MMNLRKAISGFSLIELLIAMTIGMVVLAVLGTVFSRTSSGRSDLERVTRLVENSRFAAEIIGEDVRHAGFYGTLMPPSNVVYEDALPCGWSTADVTQLGWQPSDSPTLPPRFPAPIQGWDDPGAGAGNLDCLPNRVAGTDVLVIRRVSSMATPLAGVAANNVYVQASQCVSDPASIRVSNNSAQFVLLTASCAAGSLAAIRQYMVRAYYVASCNDCAAGDGIPTLKRVEYFNGAYRETALAEGVENLQFEYAFDTGVAAVAGPPFDGVPEEVSTTNTLASGVVTSWSNAVGVRMHLLMRSSEPGLTADATSTADAATSTRFDLGPGHASVACPNRFRCRLLTTTFRLNNVAGRREI